MELLIKRRCEIGPKCDGQGKRRSKAEARRRHRATVAPSGECVLLLVGSFVRQALETRRQEPDQTESLMLLVRDLLKLEQ